MPQNENNYNRNDNCYEARSSEIQVNNFFKEKLVDSYASSASAWRCPWVWMFISSATTLLAMWYSYHYYTKYQTK